AVDGALVVDVMPLEDFHVQVGGDFSFELQNVPYYSEVLLAPQGSLGPTTVIDHIDPSDPLSHNLVNKGFFLQASGNPFNKLKGLRLSANARVDVPNQFGPQYSWRGAVAYQFESGLVTKLIAGRAFQAPSSFLLFAHEGFGTSQNVIGSDTVDA